MTASTRLFMLDTDQPEHSHHLYVTTRPLPGEFLGNLIHGGMVHDVKPDYVELAKRDDGQLITVVTRAEFDDLVDIAIFVRSDGVYSRADYEEVGMWNPEELGRNRGLALVRMNQQT